MKLDQIRNQLWQVTNQTVRGLTELGFTVLNKTGFPIVSVHVGNTPDLVTTANMLFDEGILVTVAPYPMVKEGEECHRITLTSANTQEEVDRLLAAFKKVKIYLQK